MALYKKPPLKIYFLSTNWVPIQKKMKILLEKVTLLIPHIGVQPDVTQSPISLTICK